MKHQIRLFSLFLLIISQTEINAQQYKRFALGINGGGAMFLAENQLQAPEVAAGANMKISFNNRFALRFEGHYWEASSFVDYFTSHTSAIDLNGQMIFNAISFKKRGSAPADIFSTIYFGLGGGYILGNLTYDWYKPVYTYPWSMPPDYMEAAYIVTSIGYKIKLSKVVDLYFEGSLRHTYSDVVNGYNAPFLGNKSDDYVALTLVGLQFNIGRGLRNIEWTSGYEQTYNKIVKAYKNVKDNPALNEMNNKLDSLALAFKKELDPIKTDSDKDGVFDYFDKEINSPDPKGVDKYGVTIDADGDGVPDYRDACPNEAGTLANGCKPRMAKKNDEVVMTLRLVVKSLQFEPNKAVIKTVSFNNLTKLVKLMNEYPTYKLKIEGHTDNKGQPEKNLQLSQNRANAVKAYLVKRKVDPMRVTAIGWGDTRPISSNATGAGRARNRRVELTLE